MSLTTPEKLRKLQDALRVQKALGIRKLEPPTPPRKSPERVM